MKTKYKGIEFDSQEEIEFYMWYKEAEEAAIFYDLHMQVEYDLSPRQSRKETKELKTKTKIVDKFLLHPHKYTSDFEFIIFDNYLKHKFPFVLNENYFIIVDVKGSFNQHGGDREFSINQKWLYHEQGDYVNKVVPEKLFKATWCPKEARLTPKTKQVKKKYARMKTIEEFMRG
ncbi:hypothetical protein N9924_01185 [bacterium]|nr:hypothetical protein [bacterium]